MYSREELDLIWEDYEKKYPCLACHDRPPTLYVKGESAPDWNKPLSDEEVLEIFRKEKFTRIPVYEDTTDNIIGILNIKDLLIQDHDADFSIRDIMRKPYYTYEHKNTADLFMEMRHNSISLAIVLDEYGSTAGIVTLEDVLEEIVGDIDDEYDDDKKTYKKLPDNTFIFEGKTLLTDFFRVTELNEDDYESVTEDAETLAGMLLAIKGDFPKEKEPLVYGRCRFLILDIINHRIASVRVMVMPEDQVS